MEKSKVIKKKYKELLEKYKNDLNEIRMDEWHRVIQNEFGSFFINVNKISILGNILEVWIRLNLTKIGRDYWTGVCGGKKDGNYACRLYELVRFNKNSEYNLRKLFLTSQYNNILGGFQDVERKSWFPISKVQNEIYGQAKKIYL